MKALNVVAWAILIGLGALTVVLVNRLGPVGLVIVGVLTLLVCTMVQLDGNAPTWGEHVFRARMERGGGDPAPDLRFYRWCGVGLVAAGAAALAWQYWGA